MIRLNYGNFSPSDRKHLQIWFRKEHRVSITTSQHLLKGAHRSTVCEPLELSRGRWGSFSAALSNTQLFFSWAAVNRRLEFSDCTRASSHRPAEQGAGWAARQGAAAHRVGPGEAKTWRQKGTWGSCGESTGASQKWDWNRTGEEGKVVELTLKRGTGSSRGLRVEAPLPC